MSSKTNRKHKIFVSYHGDDQKYKDRFLKMMNNHIVDKSVRDEDIDDANKKTDHVRQIIRDNFISDATVTVVLIGQATWQRKHVDWEIGASLTHTAKNDRCGLLGILLPDHPDFNNKHPNPHLIPQRLAVNTHSNDPYAIVHSWTRDIARIQRWIHDAFRRRKGTAPNNKSVAPFANNRTGDPSKGWQ